MKKLALLAALLLSFSSVWAQDSDNTMEVRKNVTTYSITRNGRELSAKDIKYIVAQDPEAFYIAKKASNRKTTARAMAIPGAVLMAGGVVGLLSDNVNSSFVSVSLVSGLALCVGSIPFAYNAKKQAAKAVNIYNENLKSTSYWDNAELNFGFTGNGIGLTLSF
ncbi:MAG: hypothetical protein MJZ91_02945 [Bacteroidales bacterium]|nr:hypothetical protein [Bacteroidales bacterium]